jgi:transposase
MIRLGRYRAVHVKNIDMQKMRSLLANRKLLRRKLIDVENHVRGTLRAYGLLMGGVGRGGYEARVRELLEHSDPVFFAMIEACWTCGGRSSRATKDCIACFFR